MGMADPLPATLTMTIRATRSKDNELTCFICGRERCEYEFSYRARGARVTSGVHRDCAGYAELDES